MTLPRAGTLMGNSIYILFSNKGSGLCNNILYLLITSSVRRQKRFVKKCFKVYSYLMLNLCHITLILLYNFWSLCTYLQAYYRWIRKLLTTFFSQTWFCITFKKNLCITPGWYKGVLALGWLKSGSDNFKFQHTAWIDRPLHESTEAVNHNYGTCVAVFIRPNWN